MNAVELNTNRENSTTIPSQISKPIAGFTPQYFCIISGGTAVPPLDALLAYKIDTATPNNTLPIVMENIGSRMRVSLGIIAIARGRSPAPIMVLRKTSRSKKKKHSATTRTCPTIMMKARSRVSISSRIIASPVSPPAAISCGARNIFIPIDISAIAITMNSSFLIYLM